MCGVVRESMRWILWSLKGSDNLAWGEAPGDRAQRTREPCRGDIDLRVLHIHNALAPWRGSIAAVRAPAVYDLAPSGLWCPAPTPTQGGAALRPGLNYLSPCGLQSADARREMADVEMV